MNGKRAGMLLAALLVVVAFVALWLLGTRAAPHAAPVAPAASENPAMAVATTPHERTVAEAPVDPGAFVSTDADGNVIADPVRDGITMVVRESNGAPCANMKLVVSWAAREPFTRIDRGCTDAAGMFPTTVRDVSQLGLVHLSHPTFGDLFGESPLLPLASSPQQVLLVVPAFATLRVCLQKTDGTPAPAEGVDGKHLASESPPRENVLAGLYHAKAVTDEKGLADLLLPVGICRLWLGTSETRRGYCVWVDVPTNGGELSLVVLRDDPGTPVDVEVELPPGIDTRVELRAVTDVVPVLPSSTLIRSASGFETSFVVQKLSEHRFVATVDAAPWRLQAEADGCAALTMPVPAGRREVRVVLQRAAPMARLVGVVLDVDGKPMPAAGVYVFHKPDLGHGDLHRADLEGRFAIELSVGGRVCVGAMGDKNPARAMVGPIELTAGDHKIELRQRSPLVVRGRVVDAEGKLAHATLYLHRPSGLLRGLATDVPEIQTEAAPWDWMETGEAGQFWFEDLGPGEHELWAFPKSGGWPARRRITPGEDVVLRLGEGIDGMVKLHVVVIDATSGKPMPEAVVEIAGGVFVPSAGKHDTVDFLVRPGVAHVSARARDHVFRMQKAELGAAGDAFLELVLAASPIRFVRVVDELGLPVHDAELPGWTAGGEAMPLLDSTGDELAFDSTDWNGRANLRGLPAGPVKLRVRVGEQKQDYEMPADGGIDTVFEIVWRR